MAGFGLLDGVHGEPTDRVGHTGMIDLRHDEYPTEMRCLVAIRSLYERRGWWPVGNGKQGWIAPRFPESKAVKRAVDGKSCLAVHSSQAALHLARQPRKFLRVKACRTAGFAVLSAHRKCA